MVIKIITINDTVQYLNRLHYEKLDDGLNIDTISIYQDLYKSFPSYKHLIGKPEYERLMDTKVLKSLLGTKDIVDVL